MNSFKPKLHLYIIKFACPCVCFLSKSIFKMCSKALNIPYFSLTHLIWYGWSALQGLNCAGLQISFQTGFALWIMHQSMILKYYTQYLGGCLVREISSTGLTQNEIYGMMHMFSIVKMHVFVQLFRKMSSTVFNLALQHQDWLCWM